MEKLRRSFRSSFRKKNHFEDDENTIRTTWPKDEAAVKTNTCCFDVKYLGCVEVFESRGMQVCEEALKLLKNSKQRHVRGTLYVSGDGMRVSDSETKGLVLDQTIEKVSFCAPDRYYEKGFSYICRDGTTRRWMCHGFLAVGDTGERLSHAVGCAFAICLDKKQQREKEVPVQFHRAAKDNTFVRFGSFNQGSITDRLKDPQEFKPGNHPPPAPMEPVENPHAVARPKASDMYLRQASMRGMSKLPGNSLFKRQYSLRLDELPSTLQRQRNTPINQFNNLVSSQNGSQASSLPTHQCTPIQEDTTPIADSELLFSLNQPTSPLSQQAGPLSLPPSLDELPACLPPPLLSSTIKDTPPAVSSRNPFKTPTVPSAKRRSGSNNSSPRPLSGSNQQRPLSCSSPRPLSGSSPRPLSCSSNSPRPLSGSSPRPLSGEQKSPRLTSGRSSPDTSAEVPSAQPILTSRATSRDPFQTISEMKEVLVTSPEGLNPWDNVPDQPQLRFGSSRSPRPASVVEPSGKGKFSWKPLERGYMSLDNAINQSSPTNATNQSSSTYQNAINQFSPTYQPITSPTYQPLNRRSPTYQPLASSPIPPPASYQPLASSPPSAPASSDLTNRILQDPFDSDWAELATKTNQERNDFGSNHIKGNSFKAFELKMKNKFFLLKYNRLSRL